MIMIKHLSFNSKLVRLKVMPQYFTAESFLTSFNSKLVRLKDRFLPAAGQGVTRFNSKLVRLKAKSSGIATHTISSVSIPNWCD